MAKTVGRTDGSAARQALTSLREAAKSPHRKNASLKAADSDIGWPEVVVIDPYSGGLALARAMHRVGASVTIVSERSRWEGRTRTARWVVAPYDGSGEAWCTALARLANSGELLAAIPCSDRASEALARHAGRLPTSVRRFEVPGSAHLRLMNKGTADGIARRASVRVPWTACVGNESDAAEALGAAPWPCVVKPVLTHEWRERYGAPYAFLVADADAAEQTLARCLRDGVTMLLSQYVPGGDDHVEEAIVVRLADGSYPLQFGCRKLRQYPRGFGATALGESSELPETMAIARRVLDEAGFVGVAGVETKRHAETGQHWFLEVNVRVPAQWGLGDACGVDASRRLIAALIGREMGPQPSLRPAVRFVVPDIDLIVLRECMREVPPAQRPALAVRFLRPWLGAGETGLLNWRDPRPALEWLRLSVSQRLHSKGRPGSTGTATLGSP